MRRAREVWLAAFAVAVVVVLIGGFVDVRQQAAKLDREVQRNTARDTRFEALAEQNQETVCSIARLVSYVPALQFEGEPRSNFVNWILSRQALLREAQALHGCSPAVEKVLRERVALDQQVLDELQKP